MTASKTLTLEYQVTSTFTATLTPDEIRDLFGLGGTATEELVSRVLALTTYDSTILSAVQDTSGEWASDNRWELRALNGARLGTEGAQWVELVDSELESAVCRHCKHVIAREAATGKLTAGPWFADAAVPSSRRPDRGAMVPCAGRYGAGDPMPHEPVEPELL